ncbi:hypothetical protein B0H65DRAFT_439813 [Neurospora tetraspora]|uniref:Uncharacterized protein n=1 Tax=Neurospora tetraspora TaxID=94610 RepID=A0AAE0JJK0_9PEZI|nr:hypothetical protein B0H65DRAFT_439813 [Neurospora tetraspora]
MCSERGGLCALLTLAPHCGSLSSPHQTTSVPFLVGLRTTLLDGSPYVDRSAMNLLLTYRAVDPWRTSPKVCYIRQVHFPVFTSSSGPPRPLPLHRNLGPHEINNSLS